MELLDSHARQLPESPKRLCTYVSKSPHAALVDEWCRSVRLVWSISGALMAILTGSSEIKWHALGISWDSPLEGIYWRWCEQRVDIYSYIQHVRCFAVVSSPLLPSSLLSLQLFSSPIVLSCSLSCPLSHSFFNALIPIISCGLFGTPLRLTLPHCEDYENVRSWRRSASDETLTCQTDVAMRGVM